MTVKFQDIYVHCGSNCFNIDEFKPIKNRSTCTSFNKPIHGTGLWASPLKTENSWKQYIQHENLENDFDINRVFFFTIGESKVLTIDPTSNWRKYMFWAKCPNWPIMTTQMLNYEQIAEDGYDAILLNDFGFDTYCQEEFHGWDCSSLIVLNKHVVQQKNDLYVIKRNDEYLLDEIGDYLVLDGKFHAEMKILSEQSNRNNDQFMLVSLQQLFIKL